jgi:hypothetical protein
MTCSDYQHRWPPLSTRPWWKDVLDLPLAGAGDVRNNRALCAVIGVVMALLRQLQADSRPPLLCIE